jgi:hypothetical protein
MSPRKAVPLGGSVAHPQPPAVSVDSSGAPKPDPSLLWSPIASSSDSAPLDPNGPSPLESSDPIADLLSGADRSLIFSIATREPFSATGQPRIIMPYRFICLGVFAASFAVSGCVDDDLDRDDLRAFALGDEELDDEELDEPSGVDPDLELALELHPPEASAGLDCQCKVGDAKQVWGPNCEKVTLTCFPAPCHPYAGNTGMWAITKIEDLPCPPTPVL